MQSVRRSAAEVVCWIVPGSIGRKEPTQPLQELRPLLSHDSADRSPLQSTAFELFRQLVARPCSVYADNRGFTFHPKKSMGNTEDGATGRCGREPASSADAPAGGLQGPNGCSRRLKGMCRGPQRFPRRFSKAASVKAVSHRRSSENRVSRAAA